MAKPKSLNREFIRCQDLWVSQISRRKKKKHSAYKQRTLRQSKAKVNLDIEVDCQGVVYGFSNVLKKEN